MHRYAGNGLERAVGHCGPDTNIQLPLTSLVMLPLPDLSIDLKRLSRGDSSPPITFI